MRGCSFDGVRFRQCGNCFLEIFLSRRRGRGALCSPTFPRATGCEMVSTLSRSPGAALVGISVSDDARGCSFDGVRFRRYGNGSFEDFVSDDAGGVLLTAFVSDKAGTALLRFFFPTTRGVGRSAPLHSLGRRGARGFRPSRALPGLFWWEIRFPSIQVILAIYLRPHGTHWGSGVVAFDQYGACTLTYLSTLDGSRGNTGKVSGLAEMAVRVGARVSPGASFLTEHRIYP